MWERLTAWWFLSRMPQRAVVARTEFDGHKSARRWAYAVQAWAGLLGLLAFVQAVACWRVRTQVDDRAAFDAATMWTYPMFAVQLGIVAAGCYASQFWRDRLCENAREVCGAQDIAHAPLGAAAWEQLARDERRRVPYPGWWPLVPLGFVLPLGGVAAWGLETDERVGNDLTPYRARLVAGFSSVAVLACMVAVACVLTIVVVRRIDDRHAAAIVAPPVRDFVVERYHETVSDGRTPERAAPVTVAVLWLGALVAPAMTVPIVLWSDHPWCASDVAIGLWVIEFYTLTIAWIVRAVWKHRLSRGLTGVFAERRQFWLTAMSARCASSDDGVWRRYYRLALATKVAGCILGYLAIAAGDATAGPVPALAWLAAWVVSVSFVLSAWVVRHATKLQLRRKSDLVRQWAKFEDNVVAYDACAHWNTHVDRR